ncbi:hypothetical protein D3C71_2209610 [compost metagenome]
MGRRWRNLPGLPCLLTGVFFLRALVTFHHMEAIEADHDGELGGDDDFRVVVGVQECRCIER